MIQEKILKLPIDSLSKVLKLLKINQLKQLETKDFSKLDSDILITLYWLTRITPHELVGREPPGYKIRIGEGLDRESTYLWIKQRHPEKIKSFEYLLGAKPLTIKQVIKVLDITQGLADLEPLTKWR